MNDLIVDVKLWGESVGSLYWEKESNAALFDYERKFIRSGLDISPIIMPISQYRNTPYRFLENRTDCFKGLPGLFADSLPDTFGNQIINEWFASKGLSGEEITPLDRLCYVGKRGMGALEFEPSSPINGMNESSVLHIEELTELAKSVFTDRMAFQVQLRQEGRNILDILKVGTSAGGAKPKAIIAYNDITGEVRSGQVKAPEGFGYWLLKFDGGKYSEHTQITDNPQGIGNIEYAYHRMAKACGIDMMECRLLQEKESYHFMTRRFDRMEDGEKIHVQTLAGLAHYDRDQRHSYEEIFRIMRQMNLPYPEQEELYRRMVFNVMSRNHDDHSKNLSFLMDRQGKWKLAPAYDLCYSYTPGGKWTNRHQLSLNGKQDNFTMEDLQKVGENMGIREHKQIIEKDLKENPILPLDYHYLIYSGENGVLKWIAIKDGHNLLGSGIIKRTNKNPEEKPDSYDILPPEGQVIGFMELDFLDEAGNETAYPSFDVFLGNLKNYGDRIPTLAYLYKDLTEYYKNKYPNAGVKTIVISYIFSIK